MTKRPASCLDEPVVPSLKLLYFDIAGKGEPIRLVCAHAGLELEDHRFTDREEFFRMKKSGELTFGQVPALVVGGGTQLVQTNAIMRYLGRLRPASGLYPVDPLLAAQVDALMDQVGDVFTSIFVMRYNRRFGLSDELMTDEVKQAHQKSIETDLLPVQLGQLDKWLERSSTGWLVGTVEPTVADFLWACQLQMLTGWLKPHEPVKAFPRLQGLIDKIMRLPAVEAYYKK
mmetsp:Transcript_68028/g.208523  ORF Transcript_68028/g.208523 Transcript_68028/m.208523 type:complete len:230 (-) Transcript_68028:132-821(-)|eukprot:CAMPEP_0198547272 /NCGR_PEP_ID=MMETSP1462-20131121/67467_1 /TAXON_ID=1333877 /ORGANISM="Brandtodinium nutriculum, Strain RCC3387" /LENGTH=229 /DNA_ID=CAMNT_0044277751 /DNA_START=91 /DNA_END=780 /DNA_ORIENTATION=-